MVDRPVDQSHLECNKISLASHLKCNALHFSLTQIIENTQCASLGFKPKSTSVADLAYMAAVVNSQTYRPLESYTVMAALYIAVLFPLTQVADWIERRMRASD